MRADFEWDAVKEAANYRKHRVDFEEATSVFNDPLAITIFDPDHSFDEERFIDIGISDRSRLLVVVYTERRKKIRIISCRKALAEERRAYDQTRN